MFSACLRTSICPWRSLTRRFPVARRHVYLHDLAVDPHTGRNRGAGDSQQAVTSLAAATVYPQLDGGVRLDFGGAKATPRRRGALDAARSRLRVSRRVRRGALHADRPRLDPLRLPTLEARPERRRGGGRPSRRDERWALSCPPGSPRRGRSHAPRPGRCIAPRTGAPAALSIPMHDGGGLAREAWARVIRGKRAPNLRGGARTI